MSRYLARFITFLNLNVYVNYAIMNLMPLLVTTALLYVPLAINVGSYEATPPLLLLGSLIAGSLGYAFDYLRRIMEITLPRVMTARRKAPPTIIPITDPLVIMEYNQWAKKLPSDDSSLVSNAINTVSKTGLLVLQSSLPQDKMELISKVLFGYARAKGGFIIKGDVNYIPSDVDWFVRTHEKSLLVFMPNNLNKKLVPKLMEYIKQSRANIILINIDDSLFSKLRKYGIEVITHSAVKVGEEKQSQVNNASVGSTEQPRPVMPNLAVNTSPPAGTSAGEDIKARDKSEQAIGKEIMVNNSITTKSTEESKPVTDLGGKEGSVIKLNNERAEEERKRKMEKGNENKREVAKAQSKGKPVTNVTLTLDPVDLINMSIKSKLIDYIDSSIRLRDMLSNLGLKYVSSILIIGPPKSGGKTALINHVAKHLGIQVIDYKDPSISVLDNAIIHVPSLEKAFSEDSNHIRRLMSIAKAKHFVVVIESSNPWSIDADFIKGNVDAIVPILPIDEDYIDTITQEKLKVSMKDREVIRGIIKSCPAVEAIEKVKLYLSGRDGSDVVCEDMFRKFQEFARSLSLK
ncbi:hypothetical protein [Vulcanisaeta souniana]|uniref:hypothetical protein n=1 Tax=Vulcanisaeta souniana TaxID=164452 RepID=UPI000A545800|nr:hypothetical protein [Vulcanisaeta souniana]